MWLWGEILTTDPNREAVEFMCDAGSMRSYNQHFLHGLSLKPQLV